MLRHRSDSTTQLSDSSRILANMSGSSGGTTPSHTVTVTAGSAEGMPRRIGRFRLLEPIAAGGMGTVYLAFAEGPLGSDRWVAIKRVHPHLASDAKFVSMFMDEARIVARLSHPNVCGLLDFGSGPEGHWLVMPYLWGESFHRVSKVARKSEMAAAYPRIAIRIVEQACEGLHAAHELTDESGRSLEVVHRDVSPQNLHVGYDGSVHVLDFGVASARQRLTSTATGEVKGKFAYMAPEQLDGQAVDRRADVFSLGIVLWESITGKRLFARPMMSETIRAVFSDPIPPLAESWPEATPELEAIVQKALARDREQRYPTARAMARDLSLCLMQMQRTVGLAEIADAMESLFPGKQQERRASAESLRQGVLVDALDEAPVVEGERSKVTIAAHAIETPPRTSRRGIVAAALIVVLIVIAASATWIATRPAQSAPSVAVAAPPSSVASLPTSAVLPPASVVIELPAPPSSVAPPPTLAAIEPVRDRHRHHASSAEAPTTASGPGTVTIATPGGWAVVYESGQRLGDAPGTFTLPAGTHTLDVQPFGRGDRSHHRVQVGAGATARVVVPVTAD